jgi:hypothetical protein
VGSKPKRRYSIVPQPRARANPRKQKIYLWCVSLVGVGICIAVLAAALAPSPGNHYQPVGGVLGTLGLLFAIWLGWYAYSISEDPSVLGEATRHLRARERARQILRTDPVLARELGIGRPDLHLEFNDGGLVDVNHVPVTVLNGLAGIDTQLAERIVSTRDSLGGFDSAGDLESLLDLRAGRLDDLGDRLIFRR